MAETENFFQIASTDVAANFVSVISKNYKTDGSLGSDMTELGYAPVFNANGLNLWARSTVSPRRSGYKKLLGSATEDFDFRWRVSELSIPDARPYDPSSNCGFVIGAMPRERSSITDIDGFFAVIDSPSTNVRRFSILYAPQTNPTMVVYSKTELYTGQFGSVSLTSGHLIGNAIRNIRFARYGTKLLCEWNYESDIANFAIDTETSFSKIYKNKIEFYTETAYRYNVRSGYAFEGSGVAVSPLAICYASNNLGDCTASAVITRLDFVPAVCLDTTNGYSGANVLSFDASSVNMLLRPYSEGEYDMRITQWHPTSFYKDFRYGNFISLRRREYLSGKTTAFLSDNKLSVAGTADPIRDVYVQGIDIGNNNKGNIYPKIIYNNNTASLDKTYHLNVCKEGYLEDLLNEDSTNVNVLNTSYTQTMRNKLYMGQNNLPAFVWNDGTAIYGRDTMFRPMDTLKILPGPSEVDVLDQFKVYERDTTSYYVFEVWNDGVNYRVYSRVFNIYDKSVSGRTAVNQNPGGGSDWSVYTTLSVYKADGLGNSAWAVFKNTKPDVQLVKFEDKHIVGLTAQLEYVVLGQENNAKVFFESYDKGSTWVFNDNHSGHHGVSAESSTAGLERSSSMIRISKNKDYFMNVITATGGTPKPNILPTFHNKDTLGIRPQYQSNIGLLSASSDTSSRWIHSSFDYIQKNLNIAVSYLTSGYVEVLKSPKFNFESMKNFDVAGSKEAQLTNRFAPKNIWSSRYFVKPFSDVYVGHILISNDRNGDLISVVSKRNDSTSFAILRTSAMKDELNVLGRFMQSTYKSVGRPDRYMTELSQDMNGDLILSTTAKRPTDATSVWLGICRYGQLSNAQQELDYDEGFLFPGLPYLASGSYSVDTTFNSWEGTSTGTIFGMSATSTVLATSYRPLTKKIGGVKIEFQSQFECASSGTPTSSNSSLDIRCVGDQISPTACRGIYVTISFTNANIAILNAMSGFSNLQTVANDSTKLRRYLCNITPTDDASARIVVFAENINLTNYEKITWDKKLDVVVAQASTTTVDDYARFYVGITSAVRSTYLFMTQANRPLQVSRNDFCAVSGENIAVRDYTNNLRHMSGIPVTKEIDFTCRLTNGISVSWIGQEGMYGDQFDFSFTAHSDPTKIVNKEPFTAWRSNEDSTTCVVTFSAADQGLQFINANVAAFKNVNFRRCYLESATSDLSDPTIFPVSIRSKEVFFDFDAGVLSADCTNFGSSTSLFCAGKQWRPGEMIDSYVQLEACVVNAMGYRNVAFKIIDNSKDRLIFNTNNNAVDSTAGHRFVIYNPDKVVKIDENLGHAYWRIRVPSHEMNVAHYVGDETAQGAVWSDRYREIGEFDLGFLHKPSQDIDLDYEVQTTTDVRTTVFDNDSAVNIEFARPRTVKRVTYSNGSPDIMKKLIFMFRNLYGSLKPLWIFDDPDTSPRHFMLCRIINEPEVEEINDEIQSISLELEELS
jgi:hypothetical protein